MAATSWIVGGAYKWTLPSKPNFYEEWTKGKKFLANDSLWFLFEDHKHTVAQATKEMYDTCNTTSIKRDFDLSGFINIMDKPILRYYVCAFHCKEGHKVGIDVKES
ncbi:cucumber peeling cupredoxin-like [Bidens hawaiensis]|uniref:cucumber peeling cupredoxin-like n=1 Tax=Bidens hawaiensis TaxID=980011 RepID=UPI00404AFE6F